MPTFEEIFRHLFEGGAKHPKFPEGEIVLPIQITESFDLSATDVIYTPHSGKKIRLKAFVWSSDADIITALRFGTGGDLLFPLQTKGAIGLNLFGFVFEGDPYEALYGYLSGAGNMKGTVLIEEI